jgi:hypothetical protein
MLVVLLYPSSPVRTPHQLRLFNLLNSIRDPSYSGGNLFFIFSGLLDTKSYF